MQLGAVILVSSCPCLLLAQPPAAVTITGAPVLNIQGGNAVSGSNNQVPPINPFAENTEARTDQKCENHVGKLPTKFYAHRKFASFFNTVVFKDMHNTEFAFVQSHFIDWKNPFGYPGATVYIKDEPAMPRQGVYHMTPSQGSYGWGQAGALANTPPPGSEASVQCGSHFAANCFQCGDTPGDCGGNCTWHENECQNAVQCPTLTTMAACKESGQCSWTNNACQINIMAEYHEANEQQNSNAYAVENENVANKNTYGNQQNRRAASMSVAYDHNTFNGIFTNIFRSDMLVADCNDNPLFTTGNDHRLYAANAGKDSYLEIDNGDTENVLLIQDRSDPVKDLVRVSLEEPCWPLFPPFCQKMGKNRQLLHPSGLAGGEFEGRIIQPEYNQETTNNFVTLKYKDGGATDIRFITLYTAYQFSNTRWSPLMSWIMVALTIIGCCVCMQCCCVKLPSKEARKEEMTDESQRLMSTIEIDPEMRTKYEEPQKRGHFLGTGNLNCCSRRPNDAQQTRTFWQSRRDELSTAGSKIKESGKEVGNKIKDSTKK